MYDVDFPHAFRILDDWCAATRMRFGESKTEWVVFDKYKGAFDPSAYKQLRGLRLCGFVPRVVEEYKYSPGAANIPVPLPGKPPSHATASLPAGRGGRPYMHIPSKQEQSARSTGQRPSHRRRLSSAPGSTPDTRSPAASHTPPHRLTHACLRLQRSHGAHQAYASTAHTCLSLARSHCRLHPPGDGGPLQ